MAYDGNPRILAMLLHPVACLLWASVIHAVDSMDLGSDRFEDPQYVLLYLVARNSYGDSLP
jgi:hypothetical protein